MNKKSYIKPDIMVYVTENLCNNLATASVVSASDEYKTVDTFEITDGRNEMSTSSPWDDTDEWGGD